MKTVKEAAAFCGLGEQPFRAQIRIGRIPTLKVAGVTVISDDAAMEVAAEPYVPAGLDVVIVKLLPRRDVDPAGDILGRSWYGLDSLIGPGDPAWPAQKMAAWAAWPLSEEREADVIGRLLLPSLQGWVPPYLSGEIVGIAQVAYDHLGHRRVLFDVQVPEIDGLGGSWVKPRRGHLIDMGRTGPQGSVVLNGER